MALNNDEVLQGPFSWFSTVLLVARGLPQLRDSPATSWSGTGGDTEHGGDGELSCHLGRTQCSYTYTWELDFFTGYFQKLFFFHDPRVSAFLMRRMGHSICSLAKFLPDNASCSFLSESWQPVKQNTGAVRRCLFTCLGSAVW